MAFKHITEKEQLKLQSFEGQQAKIIGNHVHSGDIVQCLKLVMTAVGYGLRVENTKGDIYYIFKPKQLEKLIVK